MNVFAMDYIAIVRACQSPETAGRKHRLSDSRMVNFLRTITDQNLLRSPGSDFRHCVPGPLANGFLAEVTISIYLHWFFSIFEGFQ